MNTAANPKMLLLVDDDALIAMATQMQLEASGYSIVTANTGEQAVEICRSKAAIDLILMDIDLGAGISGCEAAIHIQENHQLPVVFLSSHTEQEMLSQAERSASYGYIAKGSTPSVIDHSIKMAFRLFIANRRLAAEKEYREGILNSIGDAVIVADAEEGITFINPSAQILTGWHNKKAIGRPLEEIFSALDSHSRLLANKFFHFKYLPSSVFGTSRTLILAS